MTWDQAKETALFAKLWDDESGFINSANYLLLTTIICIGVIAGLTAIRDSVVQELGDLALGLEHLDHTYTVNCSFGPSGTYGYIDNNLGPDDVPDEPPGCIEICLPADSEGAGGAGGGGGPLAATPE